MTFAIDQIAALQAPLSTANVKKNPKGFDYVEGWHAIAEANRIFGFDGWDRQLMQLEQVAEAYKVGDNMRVAYRAVVRIIVTTPDGSEIVRDGTGYGSGIGKDLNDCHEGACKEAETDAMKRALMTFGNPFGLALYDKAKANVEAPRQGPSVAATAAMTAITMTNDQAALTKWKMTNQAMLDEMAKTAAADYDDVVRHWKSRWKAVAPTDNTFPGGTGSGVAGHTHNGEVFQ